MLSPFKEIHFWVEDMPPFSHLRLAIILSTSHFIVSPLYNSILVISIKLLPKSLPLDFSYPLIYNFSLTPQSKIEKTLELFDGAVALLQTTWPQDPYPSQCPMNPPKTHLPKPCLVMPHPPRALRADLKTEHILKEKQKNEWEYDSCQAQGLPPLSTEWTVNSPFELTEKI